MATTDVPFRKEARRVRGIFALSMCLYVACSLLWALDISLLWLELYRFVPSVLSPSSSGFAAAQTLAEFDSRGVVANILFVHGMCEAVIVSV